MLPVFGHHSGSGMQTGRHASWAKALSRAYLLLGEDQQAAENLVFAPGDQRRSSCYQCIAFY